MGTQGTPSDERMRGNSGRSPREQSPQLPHSFLLFAAHRWMDIFNLCWTCARGEKGHHHCALGWLDPQSPPFFLFIRLIDRATHLHQPCSYSLGNKMTDPSLFLSFLALYHILRNCDPHQLSSPFFHSELLAALLNHTTSSSHSSSHPHTPLCPISRQQASALLGRLAHAGGQVVVIPLQTRLKAR